MKERLHIFPDGVYVYPENHEYAGDYEKWVDACVKVENACEYEEPEPPLGIVINPDSPDYEVCIEGQLAETVIRDGKKIVTKIY